MFGVLQQATGGCTPWAARVALLLPNVRVILGVSCCLAWVGRLFFESTNTENFFPCKSMVIASLLRTILAYSAYALYFWIAGKICTLWTRTWGWQYTGWFWHFRNCRTQQVLRCLSLTLTSGMVYHCFCSRDALGRKLLRHSRCHEPRKLGSLWNMRIMNN